MGSALFCNRRREGVSSEPYTIASEPRSINDLPDEILLKILSHFGPEDLRLIIAEVCKRWNALSRDVIIWKETCYSCDKNSDITRVAKVLTVAPALHSLIIRGRKDASHILKILFVSHVDLRKLILKNCNLGDESTSILTNIVAVYPELEALSLECCHPLPCAAYSLISHLKKLSELNLSLCQATAETLCLIADNCQHLNKLNLEGMNHITDEDAIHIMKKLGKQLTSLVLDGSGLTDAAYLYLKNCVRLQELELSRCYNMTDRGLLEGIGSLQELTSLSLKLCKNLTAENLSTFLHRPSMASIVSLNLLLTNLDGEGLKGIAERCVNLRELTIEYYSSGSDYDGICMVITHCNQLRILRLECLDDITGAEFLPLVPAHLPHLRVLGLNVCRNVDEECIEQLLAAMPELVVIDGWNSPVGAWKGQVPYKLMDCNGCFTHDGYDDLRNWALGKSILRL